MNVATSCSSALRKRLWAFFNLHRDNVPPADDGGGVFSVRCLGQPGFHECLRNLAHHETFCALFTGIEAEEAVEAAAVQLRSLDIQLELWDGAVKRDAACALEQGLSAPPLGWGRSTCLPLNGHNATQESSVGCCVSVVPDAGSASSTYGSCSMGEETRARISWHALYAAIVFFLRDVHHFNRSFPIDEHGCAVKGSGSPEYTRKSSETPEKWPAMSSIKLSLTDGRSAWAVERKAGSSAILSRQYASAAADVQGPPSQTLVKGEKERKSGAGKDVSLHAPNMAANTDLGELDGSATSGLVQSRQPHSGRTKDLQTPKTADQQQELRHFSSQIAHHRWAQCSKPSVSAASHVPSTLKISASAAASDRTARLREAPAKAAPPPPRKHTQHDAAEHLHHQRLVILAKESMSKAEVPSGPHRSPSVSLSVSSSPAARGQTLAGGVLSSVAARRLWSSSPSPTPPHDAVDSGRNREPLPRPMGLRIRSLSAQNSMQSPLPGKPAHTTLAFSGPSLLELKAVVVVSAVPPVDGPDAVDALAEPFIPARGGTAPENAPVILNRHTPKIEREVDDVTSSEFEGRDGRDDTRVNSCARLSLVSASMLAKKSTERPSSHVKRHSPVLTHYSDTRSETSLSCSLPRSPDAREDGITVAETRRTTALTVYVNDRAGAFAGHTHMHESQALRRSCSPAKPHSGFLVTDEPDLATTLLSSPQHRSKSSIDDFDQDAPLPPTQTSRRRSALRLSAQPLGFSTTCEPAETSPLSPEIFTETPSLAMARWPTAPSLTPTPREDGAGLPAFGSRGASQTDPRAPSSTPAHHQQRVAPLSKRRPRQPQPRHTSVPQLKLQKFSDAAFLLRAPSPSPKTIRRSSHTPSAEQQSLGGTSAARPIEAAHAAVHHMRQQPRAGAHNVNDSKDVKTVSTSPRRSPRQLSIFRLSPISHVCLFASPQTDGCSPPHRLSHRARTRCCSRARWSSLTPPRVPQTRVCVTPSGSVQVTPRRPVSSMTSRSP